MTFPLVFKDGGLGSGANHSVEAGSIPTPSRDAEATYVRHGVLIEQRIPIVTNDHGTSSVVCRWSFAEAYSAKDQRPTSGDRLSAIIRFQQQVRATLRVGPEERRTKNNNNKECGCHISRVLC
jgi:hypothetical protein